MPTMLLNFPGRRYHATPWGHHVNEGLIEWPPSPWRILRALLAVGYASNHWNGNWPGPIGQSLITKLAGKLPTYRLPPAVGSHSRHYMPKNVQEAPTLVFDTWAQVNKGILAVLWDIELPPEELNLFATLADRLNYLGRSESWVEARLAEPAEALPDGFECYPSDAAPSHGWEQIPLMSVLNETEYADWRNRALAHALSGMDKVDRTKGKLTNQEKKVLAQIERVEAQYPPDLIGCLQAQTSWLHKNGWSQPPGSRKVLYWRPVDALEPVAPRMQLATTTPAAVECMLLSISTASGNDHALPNIARTLPQADLLHRALVRHTSKHHGNCPVLSGCDEEKNFLRGPHEHAHILPVDLDGDNHLDHILIWSPMGLDSVAQKAIRAIRQTYTKGGIGPLRLVLAGIGTLEELCRAGGHYGERLRCIINPSGEMRNCRSITPFVPPRHLKKNGRNTLEGQVKAELASRGITASVLVSRIDPKEDENAMRQRHFIRKRHKGPKPPVDCGFSLDLVFEEPVKGPICLGYGSHFGLGLFEALKD